MVVLPEPVGPVTRTMPCGRAMKLLKMSSSSGIEAEALEILQQDAGVEDAHHHFLAERDRQGGNAQLDLLLLAHGLDAAVLRPPLLGDVQPRHRLDARDHRGVHHLGDGLDVVQDAVDAEADQRHVALGLDVHVAGPRVVGVLQHVFDRVDHVLVARLDLVFALHADERFEIAEVDAAGEVALGPLHRLAQAVELGQDLQHLGLGGDHPVQRPAGDPLVGVDAFEVERIGERHQQDAAFLEGQRDHPVAAGEGPRDLLLDQVGVEPQRVDAHPLELGLVGDRLGDHLLVDHHAQGVAAQRHADHHVEGHRALLEGLLGTLVAGQPAGRLLDLGGLVHGDHFAARQDVGHDVGRQVHRR